MFQERLLQSLEIVRVEQISSPRIQTSLVIDAPISPNRSPARRSGPAGYTIPACQAGGKRQSGPESTDQRFLAFGRDFSAIWKPGLHVCT